MRLGHTEIGEQKGCGLGLHGRATVGVQGQLAGADGVLGDGVLKQWLEQSSTFRVRDTPANHAAAEDVDDHVKVEIGPFSGPISLVISQDQTWFGLSASNSGFW